MWFVLRVITLLIQVVMFFSVVEAVRALCLSCVIFFFHDLHCPGPHSSWDNVKWIKGFVLTRAVITASWKHNLLLIKNGFSSSLMRMWKAKIETTKDFRNPPILLHFTEGDQQNWSPWVTDGVFQSMPAGEQCHPDGLVHGFSNVNTPWAADREGHSWNSRHGHTTTATDV